MRTRCQFLRVPSVSYPDFMRLTNHTLGMQPRQTPCTHWVQWLNKAEPSLEWGDSSIKLAALFPLLHSTIVWGVDFQQCESEAWILEDSVIRVSFCTSGMCFCSLNLQREFTWRIWPGKPEVGCVFFRSFHFLNSFCFVHWQKWRPGPKTRS